VGRCRECNKRTPIMNRWIVSKGSPGSLSLFRTSLMRIEFITWQRLVSINERKAPQAIFLQAGCRLEKMISRFVSVESHNWRRKISNAPVSESCFFFINIGKTLVSELLIVCEHRWHKMPLMTHNHTYSWVILRVHEIRESNGIPSVAIIRQRYPA